MWNTLGMMASVLMTGVAKLRAIQDDHDLIELVLKGQMDAYQVLVERHQLWLMRAMYHLVSNREDAEELTQTVFFKAYSGIKGFERQAKFKTWLRQIGMRTAHDFYRHKTRQRRDATRAMPEASPRAPEQDRTAILEAIQEVLDQMPYPYKEILVLRYLEEMEMEEIEAILDLGKGAARMRLSRARDHFRALYGDFPESR